MDSGGPIVVIGGGHAAAQLCTGLVAAGQGSRLHLVREEPELPYHRPPLSKSFLRGVDEVAQLHKAQPWFDQSDITLYDVDSAVAIERANSRVQLQSGRCIAYEHLVIATGARARRLAALPQGLVNVAELRSVADAMRLRRLLGAATRVLVLGGGFIGLEIAATARALGKEVLLVELAPRLLMRAVSAELAERVLLHHRSGGIAIELGIGVGPAELENDRLVALDINGRREIVELLVLGVGAVPEQQLAQDAGLVCENGIWVDACMRTSDPAILAIGDCASFPGPDSGERFRLESVQNANDQARTAVATLLGREEPYCAVPSFWSEQGALRLQMTGLLPNSGIAHIRSGASPTSFSVLHYAGERLRCVESFNAPLDHMAARKLLESGKSPDPRVACDPGVPLKAHIG